MLAFIKNFISLFTGRPRVNQNITSQATIKLLLNRRSCRNFTDDEIDDKDFQAILEAGRFAPSTVNLQTWSFITFTKTQWHDVFERPIPFKGLGAIIVCADIYKLNSLFPDFKETPFINHSFAVFNAGLAAMNMSIAAEALGLNSIMLSETGRTGLLDIHYLRAKLHLPDDVIPMATIVIGKGTGAMPGIPPRQPWQAVVMEKQYHKVSTDMLKDWYQQMFIGFKLTHPFSNFQKQLGYYRSKMIAAEKELKQQYRR